MWSYACSDFFFPDRIKGPCNILPVINFMRDEGENDVGYMESIEIDVPQY